MTIVRTNNSAATQLLLAYLSAISDIAAEPLGAQEVRASMLGSYRRTRCGSPCTSSCGRGKPVNARRAST